VASKYVPGPTAESLSLVLSDADAELNDFYNFMFGYSEDEHSPETKACMRVAIANFRYYQKTGVRRS
jgi:hypothetical protein